VGHLRLVEPIGQLQDLVLLLGLRLELGRGGRRGLEHLRMGSGRFGAGVGRRLVFGDDPPDGGEDLLHGRFLVRLRHGAPRLENRDDASPA
jgi:hypothetical protein